MSSAPPFKRRKPDIDKLARSTLDSLTGSVFDDDARVARLEDQFVMLACRTARLAAASRRPSEPSSQRCSADAGSPYRPW